MEIFHRLSQRCLLRLIENRSVQENLSTQIPDFVQLVFQIKTETPTSILDDPLIYRPRLLLIIEIKRATALDKSWDIYKVLAQTDRQACHTFASFKELNMFGAIIALGDCWAYKEYVREDLRPSPTRSECLDPTFNLEETSAPMSKTVIDVHKLFDRKVFKILNRIKPYWPFIGV